MSGAMDRAMMEQLMGAGGLRGDRDAREGTATLLKSIVDIKETTRLTRLPSSLFDANAYKAAQPNDGKK